MHSTQADHLGIVRVFTDLCMKYFKTNWSRKFAQSDGTASEPEYLQTRSLLMDSTCDEISSCSHFSSSYCFENLIAPPFPACFPYRIFS